jgi:hypothetical protein
MEKAIEPQRTRRTQRKNKTRQVMLSHPPGECVSRQAFEFLSVLRVLCGELFLGLGNLNCGCEALSRKRVALSSILSRKRERR